MKINDVSAWLFDRFADLAEFEVKHVGGDVYDVFIIPKANSRTFALLSVRESEADMRLLAGRMERTDTPDAIEGLIGKFLGRGDNDN